SRPAAPSRVRSGRARGAAQAPVYGLGSAQAASSWPAWAGERSVSSGLVTPLLVVDGDSLGHRAYHAMPPVKGKDGQPVGLLLGFANMLLATYPVVAPRAVLVCLDTRM